MVNDPRSVFQHGARVVLWLLSEVYSYDPDEDKQKESKSRAVVILLTGGFESLLSL